MKGYLILTSIILLLAGTEIASAAGEYTILKGKDVICQLGPDGSFSLDYQGYRLISKDILRVKGKSGSYDYFIPEEERPPFATLLNPTFKGTPRKNHLDIGQLEKNNVKFMTCEGRKAGVINFEKSYSLYPEEKEVDIEISYKLLEPDASLEYLLVLPPPPYKDRPYVITTTDNRKNSGLVGEKNNNQESLEKVKSLEIASRVGKVCFIIEGDTVSQWMPLSDNTEQEAVYYIQLKSFSSKGTLKIKVIF